MLFFLFQKLMSFLNARKSNRSCKEKSVAMCTSRHSHGCSSPSDCRYAPAPGPKDTVRRTPGATGAHGLVSHPLRQNRRASDCTVGRTPAGTSAYCPRQVLLALPWSRGRAVSASEAQGSGADADLLTKTSFTAQFWNAAAGQVGLQEGSHACPAAYLVHPFPALPQIQHRGCVVG